MLKTRTERVTHVRNGMRIFITTECGNTFSLGITAGGEPSPEQINQIWGDPQHRKNFILEAEIINQEIIKQDA